MIGFPAVYYSCELLLLSFVGITNLLRYSNRLGGLGIPNTIMLTNYSKLLLPIVNFEPRMFVV